jgi:predicted Zn-dependent peptidase
VAVASDVLETRLNDLVPRPFILASVGSGESFHPARQLVFLPVLDGVSVSLLTTSDNWTLALQCIERETRRLLERGIGEEEMKAARIRLDQRLIARPVFPPPSNAEFLEEVLRACNERFVPMEDRAGKEALRAAAKSLNAAGCLAAFRKQWESGKPFVGSTGALDFRDSAREMFEGVWDEAAVSSLDSRLVIREDLSVKAPKREPDAPATGGGEPDLPAPAPKGDAKKYAHALPDRKPEAGEVEMLQDLRVARADFANGVHALMKHAPGCGSPSRFEVRFGEGMLALEPEEADVAKVAALAFLECGTNRNSWDDLQAALLQAHASLEFTVEGDACVFRGESSSGDEGLRRALEVACAFLEDPALTDAAFGKARKRVGQRIRDTDRPTYHNALANFERELTGGDPRLAPLERAAAEKIAFDDVRAFLEEQIDGPLHAVVVGETFLDKQIAHVASTLGRLDVRLPRSDPPEERRKTAPMKTGVHLSVGAIDISGKDTHLRIVYPCADAIEVDSERRLDLLGDLVDERLRSEIREKLGTTYSPNGTASGDRCFRGLGRVALDVMVETQKLKQTREACLAAMEQLAKSGAKKEELERLRAARSGNSEALARDLDFWMRQLRRAHARPAILDELRDLRRWYDRVALERLNALAKQTLARERASILEITPR